MQLSPDEKKRLITRLKRAEGQVAAVRRMVEDDKYCVDVLVQVSAARGALGRVGQVILRNHVETCVQSALAHGDDADRRKKIDELMDVFARFSGLSERS